MEWYNTLMLSVIFGYVVGDMLGSIVSITVYGYQQYKAKHKKDEQAEA